MPAVAGITIDTVPIGEAGNTADVNGYGAVGYSYNIGKFDVTSSQYTAFLNAVATTGDIYGLYNSGMAPGQMAACGIVQTPVVGGYTYSVSTQYQNFPVNYVTWGDAARFCNWLTNNQPVGAEGNNTTETGSYTLNGAMKQASYRGITRSANADYVIPTASEWYKAAYYDPATGDYYSFPTQSNVAPVNILSATGTNNANFNDVYGTGNGGYTDPVNYLTPVGSFAGTTSPYGTFDQAGDVLQWTEAVWYDAYRGLGGGAFHDSVYDSYSNSVSNQDPSVNDRGIGFRVVQVPEPALINLLILCCVGLFIRRPEQKLTRLAVTLRR
jgi:formylglycine-generating enzyme required for sulfatase activity